MGIFFGGHDKANFAGCPVRPGMTKVCAGGEEAKKMFEILNFFAFRRGSFVFIGGRRCRAGRICEVGRFPACEADVVWRAAALVGLFGRTR